ncbi:MAG: response regulator, partial [Bacillota bacterium]|nr:response regulator [Bacillota bacterium]
MYKIFIVEDDDVIANLIAERLGHWGFEAHICENLQDVTSEFVNADPQLVLMDISLPFFNGY